MKQLNFLHEVPVSIHPDRPHSIIGYVYELTADEVKILKGLIKCPEHESKELVEIKDRVVYRNLELLEKVIVILSGHLDNLAEVKKKAGKDILRFFPEYSRHLMQVIKRTNEEVEFIAKTLTVANNK